MYSFVIFCTILTAASSGLIPQQTSLAYASLAQGFAPGLAYSYPSAPAQFTPTAYSFSFQNRGSPIVPYGPYGAAAAPAFAYAAPAPAFGYAAPPGVSYTLGAPAYAVAAPAGFAYS